MEQNFFLPKKRKDNLENGNLRLGTIYRREYLNAFSLPTSGKVLDVGCFDGYTLSTISCDYKVGVDLFPFPNNQIYQVQANACDLPFESNYFDFILALDVIEHIQDDRRFVQSIIRVLKPGGKILLTTPSLYIRMFPPILTNYISKKWGHTLRVGYTHQSLQNLFEDGSIELTVHDFSAQTYRRYYLIARFLYSLHPKAIANWVRAMARQDCLLPEDRKGFVVLEGIKR